MKTQLKISGLILINPTFNYYASLNSELAETSDAQQISATVSRDKKRSCSKHHFHHVLLIFAMHTGVIIASIKRTNNAIRSHKMRSPRLQHIYICLNLLTVDPIRDS